MHHAARLKVRPGGTPALPGGTGLQALAAGGQRDSYLYLPPGAGGHAHHGLDLLRHLADDNRLILAASAHGTWDIIAGGSFG